MRHIIILVFLLLLSSNEIFAQNTIDIYVIDNCYNSRSRLIGEIVDSQGNVKQLSRDTSSVVKSNEKYLIAGQYYRNGKLKLLPFEIEVGKLNIIKIIEINQLDKFHIDESVLSPERFFNCNKLCDGYCEDRYSNGQVRIKGSFKSGLPERKLIYFNRDGSVERIEKFDRKGNLKSE